MSTILIIGRDAKLDETGKLIKAPTALQVFESKWDRSIGDRIRFEGEEYVVMSMDFDNKDDAIETMRGMAALYVKKSVWAGRKSVGAKF